MPIKGLTDRGMAFPEIGQIRKGAPKPEKGNRPGKDLKYFRVEFDEQEVDAQELFEKVYGTEPQEINIYLPYDEIDRCWDANLEAYTASQMIARSDGETYQYLKDHETGEVLVRNGIEIATGEPKPYVEGEPASYYTDQKGKKQPIFCKPTGRLKVIIPALERLCYLTLHTTSFYDIVNISSQLEALAFVNQGKLQGIDIVLKRKPSMVSTPDHKDKTKRVRREKWLISLEASPDWVQKQINGVRSRAELQLPEPDVPQIADSEDDEIIEGKHREVKPDPVEDGVIRFTNAQIASIDKQGVLKYEDAEQALELSELPLGAPDDHIVRWCKNFAKHYLSDNDLTMPQAAARANEAYRIAMEKK